MHARFSRDINTLPAARRAIDVPLAPWEEDDWQEDEARRAREV